MTATRASSKPKEFLTVQHDCGLATGFASAQDQKQTWKYDKWETDKPNRNWDRKALQILHTCKDSGQTSRSGHHNIFSREPSKKNGKYSIHFQREPGDRQHDFAS